MKKPIHASSKRPTTKLRWMPKLRTFFNRKRRSSDHPATAVPTAEQGRPLDCPVVEQCTAQVGNQGRLSEQRSGCSSMLGCCCRVYAAGLVHKT
jgi:hypothetical protein